MKGRQMKLKISLSQIPRLPPLRGDNIIPDPLVGMVEDGEKYSVTFDLKKDCTTTQKFIKIMKKVSNGHDLVICDYNFYPTIQVDTFTKMKKRMNWIIENLTADDDVPNPEKWLVLDEDTLDPEVLKLNALHLYFEDVTASIKGDNFRGPQVYGTSGAMYHLLEEINQLVHSMENFGDPGEHSDFFGTIRLSDHDRDYPTENLTDEDYNNFITDFEWGDLTLDYFRVGKDLQTCYATNDVELVKTKGLEQQITVHPSFEMRFQDESKTWREYMGDWIKDNSLDQYYDFTLPKFNSGRIVLGNINLTGTDKETVLKEMLKCTGITNIEMIDE
jgi:hypothetical protein